MNESVSNLQAIKSKNSWSSSFEPVSRRVGHGSMAWATESNLIQPQDGSADGRDSASRVTDISKRMQLATSGGVPVLEPEDARLTGGTRSLVRRLMGLNILPKAISPVAVKPAKSVKNIAPVVSRVQVA